MVVSAANSAARKRPRTPDQGPRAVEDQAVQAAPRPGGPGPHDSDEHGSELRSDADGGLTAVDLDEADLDTDTDLDLDDLDAAEVDLQVALAEDLDVADDIASVAEVADLAADEVDGPEAPDAPDEADGSEPDQPSAEADAEADGPGAAGARVVKISPDGGEEEETFVFGDDDDDLPAAQVAVAGATADPVKDYLKQIGKVPLLNAEQEVELAKRIEAGLFAEEKLAEGRRTLSRSMRGSIWSGSPRTAPGPRITCWRRTCGWWCRWPSGTPGGGCCSWT